jgi:hypothetical protein
MEARMSHRQLSVASELLDLRLLVDEVITDLQTRGSMTDNRREHLRRSFHQYITQTPIHLRNRAVSKRQGALNDLPHHIVRDTAASEGPRLLSAIDRLATGPLSVAEKKLLLEFLMRLDAALARGRANIRVGRYL